jgi:hypothetical protein
MDKRIRRNEFCVIGLPRCDFVFSSSRTCFIGYGFSESALEMTILRTLLEKRGIEGIEAAGELAPGQSAFCAKICSKIIQSQFCIILANNRVKDGVEGPSANVNMEYGLMLGFNKYVVPFQREMQKLPFNVAGLDTIKYSNESFARQAAEAIDVAIAATAQEGPPVLTPDQIVESFLLVRRLLVVPITSEGDRNLFQMGQPLGFTMVMTFDGMRYLYFGNFTALRPETVLWRFHTLEDIIQERVASIPQRVKMGIMPQEAGGALEMFLNGLEMMLLVTSNDERDTIHAAIAAKAPRWPVQVFSLDDINAALKNMG